MKHWTTMCLFVGFVLNDEVIGWICLLLAVVPLVFSILYRYAKIIDRETRRIGPCIDEEGFYD